MRQDRLYIGTYLLSFSAIGDKCFEGVLGGRDKDLVQKQGKPGFGKFGAMFAELPGAGIAANPREILIRT